MGAKRVNKSCYAEEGKKYITTRCYVGERVTYVECNIIKFVVRFKLYFSLSLRASVPAFDILRRAWSGIQERVA